MKRLLGEIDALVVRNVENLRWATYQSLEQTFIRFGSALDERLADTIAATQGAIQLALEKRKERSESVVGEVRRLESFVEGLTKLKKLIE